MRSAFAFTVANKASGIRRQETYVRLRYFNIALLPYWLSVPALAQDEPRVAAEAFGNALVSGKANRLRALLPDEGKIRLKLVRLGTQDGFYGAGQVEAIFRALTRLDRAAVLIFLPAISMCPDLNSS